MFHIELHDQCSHADSEDGSEDPRSTNHSPVVGGHRRVSGQDHKLRQPVALDALDSLRTLDVMTISAVISSMNAAMDELVGSIKDFCQRHSLLGNQGSSLAASGDPKPGLVGSSVAAVLRQKSPAVNTSPTTTTSHVAVPSLRAALSDAERFQTNDCLLDLAGRVDVFLEQTSSIREAAKRISKKLSNHNTTTQSFAFVGNSRFSNTIFNLPAAMHTAAPSGSSSPALRHRHSRPPAAMKEAHDSPIPFSHRQRSEKLITLPPMIEKEVTSPAFTEGNGFLPESPQSMGARVMSGGPLRHTDSTLSLLSKSGTALAEAVETAVLDLQRDKEGNKLINSYVVLGNLGKGSFGKVKLCEHKETKELFAIKVMNKSMLRRARNGVATALQQVQTEIAIMKKLRHRNVVNLYEVIDDPSCNKMYLVMQYVEKGPVLKMSNDGTCKALGDQKAKEYAKQLAAGINYLHRHNVVHRDIKPDNILLGANDTVYLSDFGVSEMLDDDSEDYVIGSQGTPAFMSPELCRGEGSVHGKAVDMWALGVTLYSFVFGKLPFFGSSVDSITHAIQNNACEFPSNADSGWVSLLSSLLNKDPNRRITASELRQSDFLFGGCDPMSSSRRCSALDVVMIDDDDIERAIAVGSEVTLSSHRTPRDRLRRFVDSIKERAAMRRDSQNAASSSFDIPSTPRVLIDVAGANPLSPHPPSPLHPAPSPRASASSMDNGMLSPCMPSRKSSPATSGAKLRAGSLSLPEDDGGKRR